MFAELTWAHPDLRSDSKEDALFYDSGYGHGLVVSVSKGERTVGVYADGEVDIRVYTLEGDEFQEVERLRYCDDNALASYGVTNDDEIWGLDYVDNADNPDLRGPNKAGFYFDIVDSNWFDLYSDARNNSDHLDHVSHSLTEAIAEAVGIVNDDSNELWEGLDGGNSL